MTKLNLQWTLPKVVKLPDRMLMSTLEVGLTKIVVSIKQEKRNWSDIFKEKILLILGVFG